MHFIKEPQGLDHQYSSHQYAPDHWALDSTKEGTCLAFVTFKNQYKYAIKLNPTDRRGYRMLVTFVGTAQDEIQSTFNRQYSTAEQRGLAEVTALMIAVYKKIGLPIVQTAQAGNNAHSLDEESGITQIGNHKEPNLLHTHLWGRGNPRQHYIAGIPLDGPKPGALFDMMAKTPQVPGNEKKIGWTPEQLQKGLAVFKNNLHQYLASSEFRQEFSALEVSIYDYKMLINKSKTPSKSRAFAGLSLGVGLFAIAANYLLNTQENPQSHSPKL